MSNFLEELAGEGYEGIKGTDIAIPFLRILQKGSPEVEEENPSYIQGAKAGVFMNSITKQIYGADIELIPIKYDNVWLEWKPNREGFAGIHEPGSLATTGDQFNKDDPFRRVDNGNLIAENMVFYCFIASHIEDGPIVFSLSSTGIKYGKMWNSFILTTRTPSGKKAPYFSSVWKLSLQYNSNKGGTWYTIGSKSTATISRSRYITEEEYTQFVAPGRKLLLSTSREQTLSQIEYQTASNSSSSADDEAHDSTKY